MKNLSDSVKNALYQAAAAIGIPAQWLYNQIQEESGFNPAARNPYTNARGLIQFMPATARALGFKDENEIVSKFPTVEEQLLNPVVKYYKSFPAPKSENEFYMLTFFPKLKNAPLDTAFPDYVKKVNPGINTIRDFVNRVRRAGGIPPLVAGISTGLILLLSAGTIFFFIAKSKKHNQERETE